MKSNACPARQEGRFKMVEPSRLQNLLLGLSVEILSARAGSQEGQFPILDLFGNMRDEAVKSAVGAELGAFCQDAWQRTVTMVEQAKPFTEENIQWLKETLASIKAMAETPTRIETEEGEDPILLDLAADSDLLREFTAESREHLDHIEEGVLNLEKFPGDAETLNTIFRAFHTFKGSAGFLNLRPIQQLAHVLESLLDLARRQKLTIDGPVIDLILRGRDTLRLFLDAIEAQLHGMQPVAPIVISIAKIERDVKEFLPEEKNAGMAEEPMAMPAPVVVNQPVVAASAESGLPRPADGGAIVKVETGKLDVLLDLIGELIIAQSLLEANLDDHRREDAQNVRHRGKLSRITKELQRVSLSLRMVPIRGTFQKMARVVRDIGARQNKTVQLLMQGDDTELDRSVVEHLNDPLLHMIRNAMDHGIEDVQSRIAQGKPAVGTITLRACHQGGNIVIELSDDGAGLNRERILNKAIERGLAREGEVLSDEEIFRFIFAPAFSTASEVTELSGRGVGLDVVKKNIEELRGSVEISSVAGGGTQFKIMLPLTLAIIDGLIVQVGLDHYVIPALSVQESFRPAADMITSVQGRGEVINVRGRLIPVLRLAEKFGMEGLSDTTNGIAIIVQSGAEARCLLVDNLISKQEVVIKNLEMTSQKDRSFAGAAILGNGKVGLILDTHFLVHLDRSSYAAAA